MSKDFKGYKLALQLRGENLQRKYAQSGSISPYFVVRRAHGNVKTDKGSEEPAIIPDALYRGNTDKASIVFSASMIRAENTADPHWPKIEIDIESLCERGDLEKKLVFDFIDYSSNEFLGFLTASVQDLLVNNRFELSGTTHGQGLGSKIVVEHADLVPLSPFIIRTDTGAAITLCGVFLNQISTGAMVDPSLRGMGEADVRDKSAAGWAYYDSVADETGNITFAVFNTIIGGCIKTIASSLKSQATAFLKAEIAQLLSTLNPSLADLSIPQFEEHDSQRLLSKAIEKAFPLVAKALFSFFDTDGNGTISKDEVIACMIAFKELFSSSEIKTSADILLPVVDCFFRAFDSNCNGIIEALELQDILEDLVTGMAFVFAGILDEVKAYLEAGILKNAVGALCDRVGSFIGEDWPLPTEDLISFFLRNYSDQSTEFIDRLKSLVSGRTLGLSFDDQAIIFDFADFFEKFEAEAIDGVVKKERCVDMAIGCFRVAIQENLKNALSNIVDRIVEFSERYLNAVWFRSGSFGTVQFNLELVHEILSASMINLQAFFRGGGARKFVVATLNLLDLNSDGLMSRYEIRGLYDSLKAVIENAVDSELKVKIFNATMTFLNMMDSNIDNKLSRDEILMFCRKMVDAFCEFYTLLLNAAKMTIKGALPSIVGLMFDTKTQLVGGDLSRLSKDEIYATLAKHHTARYPSRTPLPQLHWESMCGNASTVAALITKSELDLNAIDQSGMTPLHLAAQYSHREVVLELISNKADVRAKSPCGLSALDMAEKSSAEWKASSRMWENDAVKEILKRNFCDGWTPLMVEAEKGDILALQGLVYQRCDVSALNDKGVSALHYAASPEAVQILLNARADLDAQDSMGRTPLHYAAADSRISVIECLLDSRANVDVVDRKCMSAFNAASGNLEAARAFKLRGVDGWTQLMMSVEEGKEAEVDDLLKKASTDRLVNVRKDDGKSCLHIAAALPSSPVQQRIMQSLIAARADMNARDAEGQTPLDLSGSRETSNLLKEQGAQGWTKLMMATEKGSLDGLSELVESRADPNAKQTSGKTALHIAAELGDLDCVSYLMSVRADVNAVFRTIGSYGKATMHSVLDVAESACTQQWGFCDGNERDLGRRYEAQHNNLVVQVLRKAGAGGWTELMIAADDLDVARIRDLITQGADLNRQNQDGSTALHIAVRKVINYSSGCHESIKSLQTARALLESRADPNLRNRKGRSSYDLRGAYSAFTPEMDALFRAWGADGWTPLMLASEAGNMERLLALLSQGDDPNTQNARGYAALHHASTVQVVNALLDAKAVIDLETFETSATRVEIPVDTVKGEDVKDALRARGAGGWTSLMIEARNANVRAVQELLQSRADVNAVDHRSESAIFKAASLSYDERVKETLEALVDAKADLEGRNKYNVIMSPLNIARDDGVRSFLMSLGAGRWTPLMLAAQKGDVGEVVSCLSDPDAFNEDQMTALHIAVSQKMEYPDVVQALLAAKASPDMRNRFNMTALHLAASNGYATSVKLLHEGRADLEALDSSDKTPLYLAVQCNSLDVVRALIEAGANVDVTNKYGKTLDEQDWWGSGEKINNILTILRSKRMENWSPLMVAANSGDTDQVSRLLQSKADVNFTCPDSRSALHVVSLSSKDIVSLLVSSRANVSAQSSFGTPLQIAKKKSSTSKDVIEVLKQAGADGWTLVMIAAEKGNVEAVRELLMQGHSAAAAASDGSTALHVICDPSWTIEAFPVEIKTFKQIVGLLLDAKADIDAVDNCNRMAVDLRGVRYADGRDYRANFLLSLGAKGWTPLMRAAAAGDDGTVQNMIDDGADLFASNKDGKAAIHVARSSTCSILSRAMYKASGVDLFPMHISEQGSRGVDAPAIVVDPTYATITWYSWGTVAFPKSSAFVRGQAYYEVEVLDLIPDWSQWTKCRFGWATSALLDDISCGFKMEVSDDFGSWGVDGIKQVRRGSLADKPDFKVGDKVKALGGPWNQFLPAVVGLLVAKVNEDRTYLIDWHDTPGLAYWEDKGSVDDRTKQYHMLRPINEAAKDPTSFGTAWRVGDVIGFACIASDEKTRLSISVNGSFDPPNGELFNLDAARTRSGLVPALSAFGIHIRFNFGAEPFKYLPQGFSPILQLLSRPPPPPTLSPARFSAARLTVRGLRNDDPAAHFPECAVELSNVLFFSQGKLVRCGQAFDPEGRRPPGCRQQNLTSTYCRGSWVDYTIAPLIFKFSKPVTADSYCLVTGGFRRERDPVSWILEGSQDSVDWFILDARERVEPPKSSETPYPTIGFNALVQD